MSVVCKFSYHLRVYTGIGAVSKYWTEFYVLLLLSQAASQSHSQFRHIGVHRHIFADWTYQIICVDKSSRTPIFCLLFLYQSILWSL